MVLQLAKTTPYLSGQQRIDVELFKGSGPHSQITSGKIHVVPLSDNVVYNENEKRLALSYSHEENIKFLYTQTKDTFWTDVKARIDTLYYKDNADTFLDLYDHTCQSGTRRIRYKRYNKQFSYLLPIWIDEPWNDDWCFKFTVKSTNPNALHPVSVRYLRFSDEFIAYLKSYTEGLTTELLNINSDRKDATIRGLNATTGVSGDVDVSYIYDNILSRERPLIEFDSMLCELFEANNLIAKQLINLNFVFNMEDIVSPYIASQLLGNDFIIQVEFGKFDSSFTAFPYKDIYTNYDFIRTYRFDDYGGSYGSLNDNVLDYLDDNKCVDFIYVNKTSQPICHWTLVENPNYIYNFYGGFSPYYHGRQIVGSYYGTPQIEQKEYNESLNNIGWCKRSYNISPAVFMSEPINDSTATRIDLNIINEEDVYDNDSNTFWIEWLKYEKSVDLPDEIEEGITTLRESDTKVYFKILHESLNTLDGYLNYDITINNIPGFKGEIKHDNANNSILYEISTYNYDDDVDRVELFTIKSFKDLEIECFDDDEFTAIIQYIQWLISKPVPPVKFVFDNGIIPIPANTKNTNSTEVRYLKADKNTYNFVYRYTSHLQPMFIDCIDDQDDAIFFNNEWKCDQFYNVEDVQAYNNGIISNEEPVYPSIGYFPLSKISGYHGYPIYQDNTHYFTEPDIYIDKLDEYTWFDRSTIYSLPITYTTVITIDYDNYEDWEAYLEEQIFTELETYITSLGNASFKSFEKNIFPLYYYTINFEYASDYDVNEVNYYITYHLR